ncbi:MULTISPECIES: hypothetical protein [Rhizobium]|uniref:hypothetical protein n=1 Tax=Rhizobium TaxID=379 RepID=UPI0010317A1F|nr:MULTISPECIES: hypothetical protein [Rhizobium]MDV4153546.1 hypothetical protein [Rhizobium brockwellii]TAX40511.1 hypothetical protein ELI05_16735 [Rhizobium leguminosarum]TAX93409.1 hypothetical protein ELH97_16295 [Rhizobium leguminosarum]TAX97954.1 hypothetical protein ELH94_16205 [Rhizobium leguminosarum]TAY89240.1 hypothetical protein ELH83_16260 [Rhizobium leguminosarum]
MDCYAIEQSPPQQTIGIFRRIGGRLALIWRMPSLDLDTAPDRVKRDLGFLDGRDPYYEDERMR